MPHRDRPNHDVEARSAMREAPHPRKRPKALCEECRARPATTKWIGTDGVWALAQGAYRWWCEVCCAREQLRFAVDLAARVPDLELRLREAEREAEAQAF